MRMLINLAVLAGCLATVIAHTYHLGSCPVVEPLQGFTMNRFLGKWYVIQKTSTASKCISYNYSRGDEPGKFLISQLSEHPLLGLTSVKHDYNYVGDLSVPEPSTPGRMMVNFPLSVAGTASHVVVSTDYNNFAAVFTCQKLAFAHRQSATILSRTPDLDKATLENIHQKLSTFGVNPFDLSNVPQTDCPNPNDDKTHLKIDPDTFSSENIGKVVRKAGEKIGDGVEWVANVGSKAYHKITGTESDKPSKSPEQTTRRPAQVPTENYETNEVEWIP